MTEEQGVVLTVLHDYGPLTAAGVADVTSWPGARRLGVGRVRRVLRELEQMGLAVRERGRWTWRGWPV